MNVPSTPKRPKRLLFICSRNRLRSPTAETVCQGLERVEAISAGTNEDAEVTDAQLLKHEPKGAPYSHVGISDRALRSDVVPDPVVLTELVEV